MTLNQPFTIASMAPTLAEFEKLPPQRQGEAFLKRLAQLFPRGKTFLRKQPCPAKPKLARSLWTLHGMA